MPTTPEDFLQGTAILILPSGKRIYAWEPGYYHVQLTQVAAVEWTKFNRNDAGEPVAKVIYPSGTVTAPLTQSYVGRYSLVAYAEIDLDEDYTLRAELNRHNFDSSVLETLPSAEEEYRRAKQQSDEANNPGAWWMEPVAWLLGGYTVVRLLTRNK